MGDDGDEYDDADRDECYGENPPMDRGVLGKVVQPLFADVVTDGGCYEERDDERNGVATSEERQNLAYAAAHHLAYSDLLASVFGLKHRQAEDADDGDEKRKEGANLNLSHEAHLVSIRLFQIIVKKLQLRSSLVFIKRSKYIVYLMSQGFLVGVCTHANISNIHRIAPVGKPLSEDDKRYRLLVAVYA